jgi:CheY-like chemotaxis protein
VARILVVDRTLSVREALAFVLELEGHAVVQAAGGREALTQLETRDFDAVLVDRHMPDLPFSTFCAALRTSAPSARLVIMSMDSRIDADVEPCSPAAVLTKPFPAPTLLDAVAGAAA